MKFDIQKAFPYPVLRPYSDDYLTSDIQTTVDFELDNQNDDISLEVHFAISAPEVIDQIKSGAARYITVISCRETYYRKALTSPNPEVRFTFPSGMLRGEVRVQPYIVAITDIGDFYSSDINPEFGGGPFYYRKGHIMAMDEPKIFFIDRDLFRPITSVFDLVKNDNLQGAEWLVELDQDHVEVAVSPEMKEILDNARNSKENQAILINSIYFSAAMHAVQSLQTDEGEYADYRWAKVLRHQCHNIGIDLGANPAYKITERLMRYPLRLLQSYVFEGGRE